MEVDDLFEASSPLAERLRAEGPFESPAGLIAAARRLENSLTEPQLIATLNAHPRIGERPERLSPASLREQGAETLEELDVLNQVYEDRFGFRFVVFVDGRTKAEILEVLRMRLENRRDRELATGFRAVVDIAAQRLTAS